MYRSPRNAFIIPLIGFIVGFLGVTLIMHTVAKSDTPTKPPVTISSADLYQQQSLVRQQLRSNWDLLTPEEQTSSCNQYKTDTKGYVDGLFLGSNGLKESPVLTKKLVNDFFWSVCYRNE